MSKWKPTLAERDAIQSAAVAESSPRLSRRTVMLCPGIRYNTENMDKPNHINIALVSDHPTWDDSDLYERGEWSSFTKGVDLTEDGRAILDFYIYDRNDYELCGNVTVEYANGQIRRIHGYGGAPHNDYPIPSYLPKPKMRIVK